MFNFTCGLKVFSTTVRTVPVEHLHYVIIMDIGTLIPARRKEADGFSLETPSLLKDPVFHGVLHFLVSSEFLSFSRYANHMVTSQGCTEDVAEHPIEKF